jgi:hypothetical protein
MPTVDAGHEGGGTRDGSSREGFNADAEWPGEGHVPLGIAVHPHLHPTLLDCRILFCL